jgi:hypothetical protein
VLKFQDGKEDEYLYSVVQIKSDKFHGTAQEPCNRKRIQNSGIQRALLKETKRSAKKYKKRQ